MEFSDKLFNAIQNAGIYIDGEINWSNQEFQRFRVKNHWNRKKHLFVILLDGGASFGDWRDPSTWKTVWEKSWRDISKEEKISRENSIQRLKHEKELLRNHAIWRASLMLTHKTFLGETCKETSLIHPYVMRKRIIPYYARQIRSYLILPILDVNRNLQSLQYIKENGFKQFKKHASLLNGMVWLSESLSKNYDGIIHICEGWATGCSIYEAMGSPVICSLSASNLINVAIELRTKYPLSKLKICADNDFSNKENIGVINGRKAALLTGGTLHFPIFDAFKYNEKPSDFNDLFCLAGIEEVENQLCTTRK